MNTRLATPSVLIDINRIDELAAHRPRERRGPDRRRRPAARLRDLAGRPRRRPAVRRGGAGRSRTRPCGAAAPPSAAWRSPTPRPSCPPRCSRSTARSSARSTRRRADHRRRRLLHRPLHQRARARRARRRAAHPGDGASAPGSAFVEESRRHGELPMCGVAAVVTLDDDGAVAQARIALCGVHRRPIRARDAEAALQSEHPDDELLQAAGALAASRRPTRSATATARPPSAVTSPRCSPAARSPRPSHARRNGMPEKIRIAVTVNGIGARRARRAAHAAARLPARRAGPHRRPRRLRAGRRAARAPCWSTASPPARA